MSGQKLDLDEKIGIHFTREEWAVVLIGLAHIDAVSPRLAAIAEKLTDDVQQCAAPVGVLARVLANGPRK